MSRFRRTIALVALLAYLALSTVGAGWVVCTSANGHVAIESLAAGCCADASATCDVRATDADLIDHADHSDHARGDACPTDVGCGDCDDCGDCTDVALSDLTQSRRLSQNDAPSLPAALPVARAIPASLTICALPVPAPRGVVPRPPPQQRILSCTMLRL